MARGKLIDRTLYRKILATMPVACVEAVVTCRGCFLLLKRRNRPARGQWWLPGGRILKNETLRSAVRRKIREELGIRRCRVKKILTAGETIFRDGIFGTSTHNVNVLFLVELPKLPKTFRLDPQHSEARWFSRVDSHWHPYVKKVLRLAGFR